MSDPTTPDRPTSEAPTAPAPAAQTTATTTGTPADAAKTGSTAKTSDAARQAVSGKGSVGAGDEGRDGKKGASDDTIEFAAVGGGAGAGSGGKPGEGLQAADGAKATDGTTASSGVKAAGDGKADGAGGGAVGVAGGAAASGAGGSGGRKKWYRRIRVRRNPWLTIGGVLVVLLALAVVGYLWGLGPLNRLNTARGITPPGQLAGLDRITDQEIRNQLQLDQTREALSRINDGKQATVEAYGNLDGNRMFVVIALRGKVDIDKTVSDSGATAEQIKKVGQATCVESTGNLPTQCYRGSNTLTVIAQSANDGVNVDAVGPVAEEAFNAMK